MTRSLLPVTKENLARLGELAARDRASLFARRPETGALYSSRLFAVALCQGAALHYVDGRNGIKDFDVWRFFTEHSVRNFPYGRRGIADFGDPEFGVSPDCPHFRGRRVDLIGRSVPDADRSDPVGTLRRYLRNGKTESALLLSFKAMVLFELRALLGTWYDR